MAAQHTMRAAHFFQKNIVTARMNKRHKRQERRTTSKNLKNPKNK
jgi:hypothetical protein